MLVAVRSDQTACCYLHYKPGIISARCYSTSILGVKCFQEVFLTVQHITSDTRRLSLNAAISRSREAY